MIKFGFKRELKKQEELLFDFPYLKMGEKPAEAKKVSKFWLKNARDLLEFNTRENNLSWLFTEDSSLFENLETNKFYLINVSNIEGEVSPLIKVNLDLTFNSQVLHKRIVKLLDLDESKVHYFKLVKSEPIQGFPSVCLEYISDNEEEDTENLLHSGIPMESTGDTTKENVL